MKALHFILLTIFGIGSAGAPVLADTTVSGSVTSGLRFHTESATFAGQQDKAGEIRADVQFRFDLSDTVEARVGVFAFGRSDGQIIDGDVQEAVLQYQNGPWRLEAGQSTFTNGQSLGFSVYDVINTRDYRRDISDPDKLGQTFVGIGYSAESWDISALALYGHTQPGTANDTRSRFRLVAPVNTAAAVYDNDARENDWGYSLSATHRGSFADFEAFYFAGAGRVPYLALDAASGQFIPSYPNTRLAAVGMQKSFDTWLLGVEAGVEEVGGQSSAIYSISAEKQFFLGNTELTLIGQLARQRGTLVRIADEKPRTSAMLGGSFKFDTLFPSSFDLALTVDTDSGDLAAGSVTYVRGLSDTLELSVSYITFGDGVLDSGFSGLSSLPSDDFIRVQIKRSF